MLERGWSPSFGDHSESRTRGASLRLFPNRLLTRWRLGLVLPLGILAWGGTTGRASAQQLAFQSYGEATGLTNAWFSCLEQGPAGYVFACTEHGLYAYDGRRFYNLGPNQGLPDGGIAISLVFTADNRLIVRYPHSIFVSTTPIGPHTSPTALTFQTARSKIGPIPDGSSGQMVSWHDGAVFAGQGALYVVHAGGGTMQPVAEFTDGFLRQTGVPLHDPTPIATSGSTLWAVRKDGSVCGFSTVPARCYGSSEGLPADQWVALLPTADQHVLARSPSHLADIDTKTGHIGVSLLPNQGGRYENYPTTLLLALTPTGQLITQSADGLMIRNASGWTILTTENRLPPAPILRLMFDREGDLWFAVLGRGVMRAQGYNAWQNFDHHDDLSNDVLWQMARQPKGPLWVASDGGVDALGRPPGMALAHRHYDKAAFSIALDRFGHLWRSVGSGAIACITLSTGATVQYPLPRVSQILHGDKDRLWFITETGVSIVDSTPAPMAPMPIAGLSGPVTTAAVTADDSLWVLRGQELLHRHADGQIVSFRPHWQQIGFEPLTLTAGPAGVIWIAGAGGGLYRLHLDGDRIISTSWFQPPEVISNSIVSLLVDSRGWLWAGTDRGISAFNGRRWVSATTEGGLIWDDQDQGGLLEDDDGSMWFATSQGLSHLLDPTQLFKREDLKPVITSVSVGEAPYRERAVPYTREPFFIQFGALDFRADGIVRFRFRLDGVDKGWADTASGYARYSSVPPGHHRFELVAYNPLTQQLSAPVSVLLRVQQPWWLWWPILLAYGSAGVATAYAGLQLRFRYLLRQRQILQREVELRTAEIREAQATDSLTRLLTRGEAQSRLVAALAQTDRTSQITIGLLDIDHFKRINDRFGHLVGDEILKEMGRRLRLELKPGEYAGRYGGEEILIVIEAEKVPQPDRIQALNSAVSGEPFHADGMDVVVTCSIGVTYDHRHDDWKSLIGRADKALYQAKADGRNRIIVSTN